MPFKKYRKFFAISALFLTLIVAAPLILSSLFSKTVVNNGKISINKHIEASFLSGIQKDAIVLFFGYVGCLNVCAPTLSRLNEIYVSSGLSDEKNSTAFVFVNLTHEVAVDMPQIFASAFNKEFIGMHLSKRELLNIEREFALFYSNDIAGSGKLTHSDLVYLIKRENGKLVLKNAYMTHPLNADSLINDIKSMQ